MSRDRISFGRLSSAKQSFMASTGPSSTRQIERLSGDAQFGGLEVFGAFFSRRLMASAKP
jgi:hypothetical protein